MAVPAEIRAVPRPKNTVVENNGRPGPKQYVVRERSGAKYVSNGNPQPHNGRVIGHIVDGVFVPAKDKISLIVVIVFAILSTIFNIAGPKILAKATTALATGWIARLRGVGSIDFGYIGKILLILLAMYLCSAAFSFIQGWLMTGLSQKVCYDFRRQISEKINRLPLATASSAPPGAAASS